MGSLLGSSLALQYLDCVQDESALLRLNFWLGYALHEGEATTKLLQHLLSRFVQRNNLELNPNALPMHVTSFFQRGVRERLGGVAV